MSQRKDDNKRRRLISCSRSLVPTGVSKPGSLRAREEHQELRSFAFISLHLSSLSLAPQEFRKTYLPLFLNSLWQSWQFFFVNYDTLYHISSFSLWPTFTQWKLTCLHFSPLQVRMIHLTNTECYCFVGLNFTVLWLYETVGHVKSTTPSHIQPRSLTSSNNVKRTKGLQNSFLTFIKWCKTQMYTHHRTSQARPTDSQKLYHLILHFDI